MSSFTIEKVLWDLVQGPQSGHAFRMDPEGYLGQYPLAPVEIELLTKMDVRAMANLSINPMLLMRAYQAVFGKEQMAKYLQHMAGAAGGA